MNEPSDSKVEIRLPIHVNGFDEQLELPFVIGVLGDFVGKPLEPLPTPRLRKFVTIDRENFDDVLCAYNPRLAYTVENSLRDDGSDFEVELNFKCLADFDADNVKVRLGQLYQFDQWFEIFDPNSGIDSLNTKISALLQSVMQHQTFKDLEAAWRGLYYLLENSQSDIRVKLIHVTKKELFKDCERSVEIAATALYRWMYENELTVFAGEPFNVLIGNYEFANHPQDVALLSAISKVAALAHAPFISGVSPGLFTYSEESFLELYRIPDPSAILCRSEFKRWNDFRETEEAAYVSLCLPHFLLRKNPEDTNQTAEIYPEEIERVSRHLWGNAAFAFGAILARSFAATKWLVQIDGDTFGVLENVPIARVWHNESPIDAVVYENHFRDLSNESLNVITQDDRKRYFFLSANSCKKFKPLTIWDSHWQKPPVDEDLQISVHLSVTLARARFIHYLIKLIRHETSRQIHSAEKLQELLNNWLGQYCANSFEECSAERPLAEARIEIEELAADARRLLTAKIYIKPGYQLPRINFIKEIRLECRL